MRLTIIGSGYVGLVAGACFAELGHDVRMVDSNLSKIAALEAGQCPIHEEGLPELLDRHRGRKLTFTSNLREAVAGSEAVFIAVGTPDDGQGNADLSYVEAVARETAKAITGYTVIVEKSTVPVKTSAHIRRTFLLNGARREDFDVVSNPEFLREGTAVNDFLRPDRIVVGSDSPRSAGLLRAIYQPLVDAGYRLIETSIESAELIKHASNAFLAMKISFINAVASICEQAGANVDEIVQGVGSDSRIGPQFLRPGIGYGGSCFPKDLKAFHSVARECGYNFAMLKEVGLINDDQLQRFLGKVKKALWTLRGKKVAVLGLSFKGGTDDVRESPALKVIQMLLDEECEVRVYDPAAMKAQSLPDKYYAKDVYSAAEGADALLILTDWGEFSSLDLGRLRAVMAYPVVIDGRNLYRPETMAAAGFDYYSVGRPMMERQ